MDNGTAMSRSRCVLHEGSLGGGSSMLSVQRVVAMECQSRYYRSKLTRLVL